ncbi:Uncharacterized protein HZ326_9193 [Fusarium oxysporum f. sp. albedinis]|nr:Uncharacterized protein HZ326_9193 [Fusarium oxysporum f. sp. albedinis]
MKYIVSFSLQGIRNCLIYDIHYALLSHLASHESFASAPATRPPKPMASSPQQASLSTRVSRSTNSAKGYDKSDDAPEELKVWHSAILSRQHVIDRIHGTPVLRSRV